MNEALRTMRWMAVVMVVGCTAELGPEPGGKSTDGTAVSSSTLTGSGTVFATSGAGLNVRESPTSASAVVGWLAEGASISIRCQTRGETIGGNDVWDYVAEQGGYVADSFIYSGHDSWIPGVPRCGDSSVGDGTGGASGCGDVDYAGYCDGETLVWCEDDEIRSADCAASGATCGYQSASVGYNCLGGGGGGGGGSSGRLTVGQMIGGGVSISQDYGPTTFDGGYGYCHAYGNWGGRLVHCGLDVSIVYGTPLYVPESGTVVVAGETPYFEDETNPAAGELRIRTSDGTEIILGHMSRIDLWTGQAVSTGQLAGLSGTANGGHVHLEVRVRDGSFASGFRSVDPAVYFGL